MTRETLLDFFGDFSRVDKRFLVFDDGYRSWNYSYTETAGAAHRFAGRLREAGIQPGAKVIFWSENRPEWIVAFWGSLLAGAIVVPVDYRTSAEFVERVAGIVEARIAVTGDEVQVTSSLGDRLTVWPMSGLLAAGPEAPFEPAAVKGSDIAEIIFTSGATAEPKGVVITHRNVLANIIPVERELVKFKRWIGLFSPIRFLNLLPLSHMFGQAMATFIPPMLPGVVVFQKGHNPAEIVRQVHRRRISVIVCVPQVLEMLRGHVSHLHPELAELPPAKLGIPGRWWRYRQIHRLVGWKFWAFVVGAAPLEPELEEFWTRMGFAVIQGYGLTETAPIVTLNHPLHTRRGSVGKPIPGVEIKIASDGEILVRGENVTSGYYNVEPGTDAAFDAEGWFHTGDIGAMDEAGRLLIRGRKKEMIVTPEGLNVFPEDVERVLNEVPGVKESAAVGIEEGGRERVYAVVVAAEGSTLDVDAIARDANAKLEAHQRVRQVQLWPAAELPRTEGTRKLKRREVKQWLVNGAQAQKPATTASTRQGISDLLARYTGGRDVPEGATLEQLGLSSLERVELLTAIESRYGTTLSETAMGTAPSVTELERLAQQPPPESRETFDFPDWNRRPWSWWLRRLSLPTWILPIARVFAWVKAEGRENLQGLKGPVIFASNHQSHMDTPVVFMGMPARWRYHTAIAMSKEFFHAHFYPEQHTRSKYLRNTFGYLLAAQFFNAFPLPQRESGARHALRYAGDLISNGWSILIYPEGKRTVHGEILPFQPGVGMMASRLRVPVVPVRIVGVHKVLHPSWRMARPGKVKVVFGKPLQLEGDDYAGLARQVEEAVRALAPDETEAA